MPEQPNTSESHNLGESESESVPSQRPISQENRSQSRGIRLRVVAIIGSVATMIGTVGGLLIENGQLETIVNPLISALTNHNQDQEIQRFYRKANNLYQENITLMETAEAKIDDWDLVERQWSEAISELKKIPDNHTLSFKAKVLLRDCQNYQKYSRALLLASRANDLLAQNKDNSLPIETWQKIEDLWEESIENLNTIDADAKVYQYVKDKLNIYRLSKASAREHKIWAPWLQGIRNAQLAANQSQYAQTTKAWTDVITLWKDAIRHLSSIENPNELGISEDLIAKKLREYNENLDYAKQQLNLES